MLKEQKSIPQLGTYAKQFTFRVHCMKSMYNLHVFKQLGIQTISPLLCDLQSPVNSTITESKVELQLHTHKQV